MAPLGGVFPVRAIVRKPLAASGYSCLKKTFQNECYSDKPTEARSRANAGDESRNRRGQAAGDGSTAGQPDQQPKLPVADRALSPSGLTGAHPNQGPGVLVLSPEDA